MEKILVVVVVFYAQSNEYRLKVRWALEEYKYCNHHR
jgi:hypothetical protein